MDLPTSPVLCLLFIASSAAQLLKGQQCVTFDGEVGLCENIDSCKSALEGIHNDTRPTICSFDGRTPIVCCVGPPEAGSKAARMCREYSLVTRHYRDVSAQNSTTAANLDVQVDAPGIIGGTLTPPKLYPHMTAIGFGDEGSISWLCGGSLISARYVLTAAHCVSAGSRGLARWVLLGVVDLTKASSDEHAQLFSVAERTRHPDYKRVSKYHDIALLKLDRDVATGDYARPACLQVAHDVNVSLLTAVGWGLVHWADERGSSSLMSVGLPRLPVSECNAAYRSLVGTRQLAFGVQADKMMCAGHKSGGKDTCQGDSGGPLQYTLDARGHLCSVVGVTSFGLTVCGARNSPAVYTRVSYYVPWIESIVWP